MAGKTRASFSSFEQAGGSLVRVAKKAKKQNFATGGGTSAEVATETAKRMTGPSAGADSAEAQTAAFPAGGAAAAAAAAAVAKGTAAVAAVRAAATRANGAADDAGDPAGPTASTSCWTTAEENRLLSAEKSATCTSPPSAHPSLFPSPSSSPSGPAASSPLSSSACCSASSSRCASSSAPSSSSGSSASCSASTFAASSFFAEERKKGVLYIARLPPKMNRVTLRRYFDRFGTLGRLHVAPLLEERSSSSSKSRGQRRGGGQRSLRPSAGSSRCGDGEEGEQQQRQQPQKGKNALPAATSYRAKAFELEFPGGAEAWLEFLSRKDAKRVARLLDGQPVSSWAAGMGQGGRGSARRARRQWNGDIWCLKYLRGFTWQQLIEEKVYNRRVREARLNAALSQIKRENAVYVQLVEQQKQIDKMREKRKAKLLQLQDLQQREAGKQEEEGKRQTPAAAARDAKEEAKGAAGPRRTVHGVKMSLLGGNLWETPCADAKKLSQSQNQHAAKSSSNHCNSSSGNSRDWGNVNNGAAAAEVRPPARGAATLQRSAGSAGAAKRQEGAEGGKKLKRRAALAQTKQTTETSYAELFDLF